MAAFDWLSGDFIGKQEYREKSMSLRDTGQIANYAVREQRSYGGTCNLFSIAQWLNDMGNSFKPRAPYPKFVVKIEYHDFDMEQLD
jgi:hypothetical protein